MFKDTFSGCTGLTSLPTRLFFSNATSVSGASGMFFSTFSGCTGLTSLPSDLFSKITSGASYMFQYTFNGCTNLGCETAGCSTGTGYIPKTLFAGITPRGSNNTNTMFYTFQNTKLVTSCPTGTTVQYITGWEGSDTWANKVSCEPLYTCASGYYLPANATNCVACPSGKACPGGIYMLSDVDQGVATEYTCASGQYLPAGANGCSPCESGYFCPGGIYYTEDTTIDHGIGKFLVTTTTGQTTFDFTLSAVGTFTVNCGDDGTLSGTGVSGTTITRTNTTSATYTCTWGMTNAHTIYFDGLATNYNTSTTAAIAFSTNGAAAKIASIDGNLSAIFPSISGNLASGAQPRFSQTFSNATNLTSIPATLFANYTSGARYMFSGTFAGCSGLTSLPSDLFGEITSGAEHMFNGTFSGCTGLTSLSSDLFSKITSGATGMFNSTFRGCTGLTSLPTGLFFSNSNATSISGTTGMFVSTFQGCTGLTSLPTGLFFPNVTSVSGAISMFQSTFQGCTGLTSLPNGLFFPNATSVSVEGGMFYSTFSGCTGLTSLPSDLFSKITTVSGADRMFYSTFSGCTGLTSLPAGLFLPDATSVSGISGTFIRTFQDCTGLTSLPTGLFLPNATTVSGNADSLFASTFSGCTGLTSLPTGLFFPNATSVSGGSRMFESTFSGCSRLTSLPPDLFSKITSGVTYMFYRTFSGCSGLTSLPTGLFLPNVTTVSGAGYMFQSTFQGCTGLTSLPTGLFLPNATSISGAIEMFSDTFSGCIGLTSLPTGLFFPNATSVSGAESMFLYTFNSCTGLTSLPSDLFSRITSGAKTMFYFTFRNCTNLGCETAGCSTGTGYIPKTLFAGITPRGSNVTNTMSYTFQNTKLVTECPPGTVQYITEWEGGTTWNDKVSCESVISHNITYELNGGTNYNNAPDSYFEGGDVTINGIPTKSGYTFAGWCTDAELQNCAMSQTISAYATSDKTFYAKWTQCQACDATNASCSLSVVNNTCTYTTSCNTGYGNIQNNGAYNVSCSVLIQANITYVMNDGTNYINAPTFYYEGSSTTINGVPTKEYAAFAGWCTDEQLQNCAMSQTISASDTGDKTFYAKWTECSACSPTNASCTFDGIVNNVCTYTTSCNTGYGNIQNNGKYNASCSLSTYNITYDLTGGVSCAAYCNLFDNQWAQGGGYWYNDNNGNYSKRIHAVNLIPVTPNTTYTISRTGNLRLAVQQYANNVKSSTSNPYLRDSGWVSSSTTTYTFTTLSNTRYVWLQLSSNNYSTDITPANGEATNVQFELGNVAHAFVPYVENCNAATAGNCGTNYANAPTTYTFGTGATINGVPTREGYVFKGWCTDSGLTSCAISQTISASATGNKTFYAKWIEQGTETYNVTYACGDGTGTAPTDSTEYISDESVTTLSNTCSKTNSVFTNWSCGESTVVAGGTFTITDDTTCTAQWSSCTQCAATNASCSLSVVNNVCTYTTSCNTGYGDIQNNGQYNASCSANDITLVYHDEEGNEISTGSCEYGTVISLPDTPVKQGYKFKGWTVVPAE